MSNDETALEHSVAFESDGEGKYTLTVSGPIAGLDEMTQFMATDEFAEMLVRNVTKKAIEGATE